MEFARLPKGTVQHIFSFLNHKSRMTVLEVCRKWNDLTYSAQFMDRIRLRLTMDETHFIRQVTTLRNSFRNYRHVVIDCRNSVEPIMNQLAEIFSILSHVETLELLGIQNMPATESLILLQNIPSLKRIHFVQDKVKTLEQDLPKLDIMGNSDDSWIDIFTKSSIALRNINEVVLLLPKGIDISVASFQQMLPSVTQLEATVNHPSIVNLIDAYKYQLKSVSIHSISRDLFSLFCYISFPKLSYFYINLGNKKLTNMIVKRWNNFFKCPDHTRNLRQLKLFPTYSSILRTICTNCTSLQELDVSVTNIDFLENISNLTCLKKLLIQKTASANGPTSTIIPTVVNSGDDLPYIEPILDQKLLHNLIYYSPIPSLTTVEISGAFLPTHKLLTVLNKIAPNLETLSLKGVGQPEEILQALSEMFPNVRRLELSFMPQPGKPPCLHLGYLLNKTNLVTYSLANVVIDSEEGIPNWIQLAPNVSKITLARCKSLTDAHLASFGTSCAKLTQLELKDCLLITVEGLTALRKKFPHITITCESPRVK